MNTSKIEDVVDLITHGVYIIGVRFGTKMNVMTAAWVSQVSSEPPMVSVSVEKTHYTAELIPKAKSFSVSILSIDQMELARKCGFISGRENIKIQEKEVLFQVSGAPILKDCAAYLDCELSNQVEVGNNILFIGKVLKAKSNNRPVLVYRSRDFF